MLRGACVEQDGTMAGAWWAWLRGCYEGIHPPGACRSRAPHIANSDQSRSDPFRSDQIGSAWIIEPQGGIGQLGTVQQAAASQPPGIARYSKGACRLCAARGETTPGCAGNLCFVIRGNGCDVNRMRKGPHARCHVPLPRLWGRSCDASKFQGSKPREAAFPTGGKPQRVANQKSAKGPDSTAKRSCLPVASAIEGSEANRAVQDGRMDE